MWAEKLFLNYESLHQCEFQKVIWFSLLLLPHLLTATIDEDHYISG